ncbi:MAG TPA: pteridine reductase, partial [Gammaproteobacteria bacterium]
MTSPPPVALVTGAARRIGAVIAERLHAAGYRVVIHYRKSGTEARALADRLEQQRPQSAAAMQADLLAFDAADDFVSRAAATFGRLDLLVNNASSFFPTPVGATTPAQWNDLVGSNFAAPFFLSQAALPHLRESKGAIVNLIDIHGERPLKDHAVYSAAKAGLHMLTRALAKELAPAVRVNGVAPGAILWPEKNGSEAEKRKIIEDTPLRRTGTPQDIAE